MRALTALAAFILLAFSTAPAFAQTPAPAIPAELPRDDGVSINPADAPAGAYELDSRHVSVIWRVRHTGLGIFVGRFNATTATLNFDSANPANSTLDATIDVNSVSTGLPDAAGAAAFNTQIANVLGVATTPQIHFVSTSATVTGPNTGLVTGDLTMNGQTHPATFEVTYQGGRFVQLRGKHTLAFSARTIIDRKQWGVGSLIFDRFAGDEIEIVIEAEFPKA